MGFFNKENLYHTLVRSIYRNVFFGFFLPILLIPVSCLEDSNDDAFDPVAPSVEVVSTVFTQFDTLVFSGEELEMEPLDQVAFEISITAEGGFAGYSIFLSVDGAVADTLIEVSADDLTSDGSITYIEDKRSFEIPSELTNSEAAFRFIAYDQLGQNGDKIISLVIESPLARPYDGVRLYEPQEDYFGACFFRVTTGEVYSPSLILDTDGLASSIDFGYYYGASDSATIASPKGFEKTAFVDQVSGWNVLNATLLRSTSIETLEGISRFEDIDIIFEQSVDESGSVSDLKEGKIVAFETVRGKRGLLSVSKIVNLDDTAEDSRGYIELDVLVQERVPRN